jgi:hypothetical protein
MDHYGGIENEHHTWSPKVITRKQCTKCLYILGAGDYDESCLQGEMHSWKTDRQQYYECKKCGVNIFSVTKPPRIIRIKPSDVRLDDTKPRDYKSYKPLSCDEYLIMKMHEDPWPLDVASILASVAGRV